MKGSVKRSGDTACTNENVSECDLLQDVLPILSYGMQVYKFELSPLAQQWKVNF